MYRQNEATLVSAVLDRKLANDRSGAVEAAVKLWIAPEERASEPDAAHAEVWSALVAMGITGEAAAAAVDPIRRGEKIRFQAFIDVGEAIDDPATHKQLAKLALDRKWESDYVFAALVRLVELNREADALDFIRDNTDALLARVETWTTIAALMTTTRVGKREDLTRWFEGFESYTGVPMWIAQAYASTLWQPNNIGLNLVSKVAERALAACAKDATAGYFGSVLAIADLRAGRDDAFRARMTEHGEALAALVALADTGGLDHPATRYLNRVKHARPITIDDLTYEPLDGNPLGLGGVGGMVGMAIKAATAPKRPLNAKEGMLLRDLVRVPLRTARILPLFVQMYDLPKGAPEVSQLCTDMRKARPSELPWLVPAWSRMVKARVGWKSRIMLALGLAP